MCIFKERLQPFTLANVLSFSIFQNTGYRETNFLLKQLHFQNSIDYIKMRAATSLKQLLFCKKNFFRTPSCLGQLLLSNNYFLTINTFSDRLLLKITTFLAQLLQNIFQNIYFFEASTSFEKLHFQKNLFQELVLFLENSYLFFTNNAFISIQDMLHL